MTDTTTITPEERDMLQKAYMQGWDIDEGDLSIYRDVDGFSVPLADIDYPEETARELAQVWQSAWPIVQRLLTALEAAEGQLKEAQASVHECEEGWTAHCLEQTQKAPLTKQGRAAWWATIESSVQHGNAVGHSCMMEMSATDVQRLLELIEAAEARAEKAEAERDRLQKMVEWLAGQLHGLGPKYNDVICPQEKCHATGDCIDCWKEAARRAVAEKGE